MTRPTIEAAVAALPADTAKEARTALDWMLPEGDRTWSDLTQLGLQRFLWYELPVKWLSDEAHQHEVAWALADLFASVGMDRYAGLCRSEETHRLIARWEGDSGGARAQTRRLMEGSGVDPLDTSLLVWGDVQGMEEHAAAWRVSWALEAALDQGRLVPGARGWRTVATDVANQTLLEAVAPDDPRSVIDVVEAERRESFLVDLGRRRLALGGELKALLTWDERATRGQRLAQVAQGLEPLRWLLTEIGDGVKLTQAGYLPKALALAADERYDWFDLKPRFSVRGERDLLELVALRELARERRLVTVRTQRMSLSARGRAVLNDPVGLATEVLTGFFNRGTWRGDAALAVAVDLLSHPQDGSPLATDDLEQAVFRHLSVTWRRGTQSIALTEAAVVMWDVLRLADVFGWVERDRRNWPEAPRLTPAGRLALLTGLRAAAIAPQTL